MLQIYFILGILQILVKTELVKNIAIHLYIIFFIKNLVFKTPISFFKPYLISGNQPLYLLKKAKKTDRQQTVSGRKGLGAEDCRICESTNKWPLFIMFQFR